MRVVAGTLRGRRLVAPEGLEVRPTPDRVREALFDILGERVRGCAFLDLFAGSGANAIEAASRGADRVVVVENGREALRSLETNLETLGLAGKVGVIRIAWPSSLHEVGRRGPFSIIFADPPYAGADYQGILESASGAEILAPDGVVILEHEARNVLPAAAGGLRQTRLARYGRVAIGFYSRSG